MTGCQEGAFAQFLEGILDWRRMEELFGILEIPKELLVPYGETFSRALLAMDMLLLEEVLRWVPNPQGLKEMTPYLYFRLQYA
jgi:hypothetical protein